MKLLLPTLLAVITISLFTLNAVPLLADQCVGFTTDPNNFSDVSAADLLPEQGYNGPQPIVRGEVAYTGQTLEIGTNCAGAYGTLAMCDFSSPVTGLPETGTILFKFGVDYWADVWINAFQLEVELQSGAIENFTATVNEGFVGFCAPAGDPIVRVEMVGHDGVALGLYHGDNSPVATEKANWETVKVQYRN